MSQVFSPSPSPSDRLGSPTARVVTLDWSDAALARTWRTAGMVSLGLGVVLHACASWIPGTILLLTGTWAVAKGSPRWRQA
jgi:hypothetical protein